MSWSPRTQEQDDRQEEEDHGGQRKADAESENLAGVGVIGDDRGGGEGEPAAARDPPKAHHGEPKQSVATHRCQHVKDLCRIGLHLQRHRRLEEHPVSEPALAQDVAEQAGARSSARRPVVVDRIAGQQGAELRNQRQQEDDEKWRPLASERLFHLFGPHLQFRQGDSPP